MKKGKGLLYSVALALTLFTSCSKTELVNSDAAQTNVLTEASSSVATLKANYGLNNADFVTPITKVILNSKTYNLEQLSNSELETLEAAFTTHHQVYLDEVGAVYLSSEALNQDALAQVYNTYLGDNLGEVGSITAKSKKRQRARVSVRLYPYCDYGTRGHVATGERLANGRPKTEIVNLPTRTFTVTAGNKVTTYKRTVNSLPQTVKVGQDRIAIDTYDSARTFTWNGDQNVHLRFKGYSATNLKGKKRVDKDRSYNSFQVKNRKWDVIKCGTMKSFDFDLTVTRNRK